MDHADEWDPRLDLRPLLTPIEGCVRLSLGPVDPSIVEALEAAEFDQAPVVNARDQVIGVVETTVARRRSDLGERLRVTDLHKSWLAESTRLTAALGALQVTRSVLVRGRNGRCIGLVTISDLSHHEFRMAMYGLLAQLEVRLAHVIRDRFPNPWEWIDRMSPDNRVAVVGYWEIGKRAGVDIGPTASLTLSQLVNIVSSSDVLVKAMRFRSKKELKDLLGKVPQVRNDVMHPVRPLVLGVDDVLNISGVVKAAGLVGARSAGLVRRVVRESADA